MGGLLRLCLRLAFITTLKHTRTLSVAAWLVELSGHLQWWSVKDFVEEFACIMNMQLDLRSEAVRKLDALPCVRL